MEKINESTNPHKSRSMLLRLLSGDRSALTNTSSADEDAALEQTLTDGVEDPQEAVAVQPAAAVGQPLPEAPISDDTALTSEATEVVEGEESTEATEVAEPPEATEATVPELLPVDAGIEIRVLQEGMEAYVVLTPPENGGAEAGPKLIRAALKNAGVVYGIMDRIMFEIAMSKPYNQGKILVAQGTPKEDGVDASIEEHFSQEIDISPYQNADGTVDYKRLNIVREVKAGTAIATMIPCTQGVDGTNVRGELLKAKPGKPVQLLRGANIALSPDGLQILAEKSGHLTYKDGRFLLETIFTVDGSVDNNTGNIAFCGDVLIKGDVREGYTIRSGGSVRIKGVVEGGSIYADGDVIIDGGFNGMKRGEVEAGKGITSKFLQNCTVRAKDDIKSGAVINSIVFCDGQLVVTSDKGVIVGGRCTVLRSVEAKVIGTDVNTPTQITVGLSPTILAEKQELEQAVEEVESNKDMLNKNLIYLERCAKMGKLSDKNIALQESCNKQKILIMVREATYHKRLEAVNDTIEEAVAGSMVKAQTVYPSTKISIKSQSLMTKTLQQRCIFRMEKGELITTTF